MGKTIHSEKYQKANDESRKKSFHMIIFVSLHYKEIISSLHSILITCELVTKYPFQKKVKSSVFFSRLSEDVADSSIF
jgi:hypothetical protein